MDKIWKRAVETVLDGQSDPLAVRTLTLDGAVKCSQGRFPRSDLLERFRNLEHLSIARIGVSSLEQFPRLGNLQTLVLSDNRIAGGLKFLVQAGLDSLRDLDLSYNRIEFLEDLMPLAQLKLDSLDLHGCLVTRVKDYRSRVFGLIKSLKYLDRMDAEENESPESDEGDDPGSWEVDGVERPIWISNGHSERMEGVVEIDDGEEGESEEETETGRQVNGVCDQANGFKVKHLNVDYEDDNDDYDDDEFGGEEINEEGSDDVVEVHEIEDNDDDADDNEYDDDDEEEEVDIAEGDCSVAESNELLTSTDGESDGNEQEEDDDGDGETEEGQGVEDSKKKDGEDLVKLYWDFVIAENLIADDEEDNEDIDDSKNDAVQVIRPPSSSSRFKRRKDDDDDEDIEDSKNDAVQVICPPSSSSHFKKQKIDEGDFSVAESNELLTSTEGEGDGDEQEEDDDGDGETEKEQGVEDSKANREDLAKWYWDFIVAENLIADDEEDDEDMEDSKNYADQVTCPPSSSSLFKRKRDNDDDDYDDDDDDGSSGDDDDDDD